MACPARVLVLTTYDTDSDVVPAIEAGATGYLLKDSPRDELFRAVRAASRGESVLAPSVATRLMSQLRHPAPETLSERELEVLSLIAQGETNRGAAARLFISRGDRQDPPAPHLREAERQRPCRCRGDGIRARAAPDQTGWVTARGFSSRPTAAALRRPPPRAGPGSTRPHPRRGSRIVRGATLDGRGREPGSEGQGDLEIGLECPGGSQAGLEVAPSRFRVAALQGAPAERPLELDLQDAGLGLVPDPAERLDGDGFGIVRPPRQGKAFRDPGPGLVHVTAGADALEASGGILEDRQSLVVAARPRCDAPEVARRESDADLVAGSPQTRSASRRSVSAGPKRPWSERTSASLFDWVAALATSPARVLTSLLRAYSARASTQRPSK